MDTKTVFLVTVLCIWDMSVMCLYLRAIDR